MDKDEKEVVRVGRYYGPGRTNNEAEAFALRDAIQCLVRLQRTRRELFLPARVFGDSQLIIRFATRIYKRPTRHSIYWALEEVRKAERSLDSVAYRHVGRDFNQVADDMGRRALEARADVIFWSGSIPDDAPPNQVKEVYTEQEGPCPLDWQGNQLPIPLELVDPEPSVSCVFGGIVAAKVT